MRSMAALLVATTVGAATHVVPARADRPKEQGGDPPPAPTVIPPAPPVVTPAPPAAPTSASGGTTVVVAPSVSAAGTIVVAPQAPGAAPSTPGPAVIVPQGVPIVIRDAAPEAASIEHRLVTVDGTVLGACMGNCTFQVPPGTYVVESGETEELRAGRTRIVANGPTLVDVHPGSKSNRTTGLALGVTGSVGLLVGFFGTFFTMVARVASDCASSDRACQGDKPSYTPWVLTLTAGAAASGVGWWMFATSGTRMRASPYAPAVAFTPLVTSTVQGAALSLRF